MMQKAILQAIQKTVTYTSDGKGKFTDTSNGILKQKLLSKRTLPVIATEMDSMIENRIVTMVGASHTLVMTATKEVVADALRTRCAAACELIGLRGM